MEESRVSDMSSTMPAYTLTKCKTLAGASGALFHFGFLAPTHGDYGNRLFNFFLENPASSVNKIRTEMQVCQRTF